MKRLVVATVIVIAVITITSLSCVSKDVQIAETYYQTEYRQEPYVTTEQVEVKNPNYSLLCSTGIYGSDSIFLLFNKVDNSMVRWARVTAYDQYPIINTISIAKEQRNPRISIKPQNTVACLDTNRTAKATDLGFRPILDAWKPSPELYFYNPWITSHDIELITTWWAYGYDSISSRKCSDAGKNPLGLIEFSFEEMLLSQNWALIYWSVGGKNNAVVNYAWDDIKMENRVSTKYRDVPVQVEKQRMVTKTIQAPFWEAIFTK